MEEIVALVSGGPTGPRQGAKNSISAVRLRAAASERPNSSRSRQYRGPSQTAELLKSYSSVLTLRSTFPAPSLYYSMTLSTGPPLCYNGAEGLRTSLGARPVTQPTFWLDGPLQFRYSECRP